jgi:E3 ubiquitin-protein ligase TRIP12
VDLFDVRRVDAGLGATLEKLAAASGFGGGGGGGRGSHAGPLTVDGVPIEDLCLSFVLPG